MSQYSVLLTFFYQSLWGEADQRGKSSRIKKEIQGMDFELRFLFFIKNKENNQFYTSVANTFANLILQLLKLTFTRWFGDLTLKLGDDIESTVKEMFTDFFKIHQDSWHNLITGI